MSPRLFATVQSTGQIVPVLVNEDGTLVAGSGPGGGLSTLTGSGDPNGSVSGTVGQLYLRESNNTLYANTDSATGWTLVAGGTTGPALYAAAGSPEGVQTAAVGSYYLDTTTYETYRKLTGSGSTGWG